MPRPREILLWACAALVCLNLCAASRAEETESAAVRAAARDYAAAVGRAETEALLRAWTKDGDYVDANGQSFRAHEMIRKMAAAPRADNSPYNVAPPKSSLRFITPTVAIEDGTYDCGNADDGSAISGHFTAVWVKRENRWLLDSLREAATQSRPSDEHLKPLEWLLGEWVGKSDGSVMLVSAHISDRGNHIIREFGVLGEGGEATATERIAWDPISGDFKSWTFDSQDGRGEGSWKRDGNRWLVTTTEVMGDGKSATTSAIITPINNDQFVWEAKNSKVGDQDVPSHRVKFTRAPEVE